MRFEVFAILFCFFFCSSVHADDSYPWKVDTYMDMAVAGKLEKKKQETKEKEQKEREAQEEAAWGRKTFNHEDKNLNFDVGVGYGTASGGQLQTRFHLDAFVDEGVFGTGFGNKGRVYSQHTTYGSFDAKLGTTLDIVSNPEINKAAAKARIAHGLVDTAGPGSVPLLVGMGIGADLDINKVYKSEIAAASLSPIFINAPNIPLSVGTLCAAFEFYLSIGKNQIADVSSWYAMGFDSNICLKDEHKRWEVRAGARGLAHQSTNDAVLSDDRTRFASDVEYYTEATVHPTRHTQLGINLSQERVGNGSQSLPTDSTIMFNAGVTVW